MKMRSSCPQCSTVCLSTSSIPGAKKRFKFFQYTANAIVFISIYLLILTADYAVFISLSVGWLLSLFAFNLKTFVIQCDLCGWSENK